MFAGWCAARCVWRAIAGIFPRGVGSPLRTRRRVTSWRRTVSWPIASELDRGDPRGSVVRAQILYREGRYRDAIESAREALSQGDGTVARVLLARALGRRGPEGREEATAHALAVIDTHAGEDPHAVEALADMARIAHDGGAGIERCREADDRVQALRGTVDRPEEWLGAAAARRCHGVWAEDAPAWLADLAVASNQEPVELARWLVERVEALQRFRLVAGRALFGAVEGLHAERCLAPRAEELLAERYSIRVGPEGVAPELLPETRLAWDLHVFAVEAVFGEELALLLRASERAQAVLFGSDSAPKRDVALSLAALEAEHAAWIRWAGTFAALDEVVAGDAGGFATGTTARLKPVLELARSGDEEAIRSAAWSNRWHEAERR